MLFRAQDLNEAIEIANDTPFGLGASVWTADTEEQKRLIAELACGQVFVNTIVASDPRLPFGGIKRSGYGRELSAAGMREFLNAKTVVIAEEVQQTLIPFESLEDALEEPVLEDTYTQSADVENAPSLAANAFDSRQFRDAFQTALTGASAQDENLTSP